MTKPFKTYKEQLSIMRSRNITINSIDEDKVIRILSRENYYSIINGYKDIYLDYVQTSNSQEDYFISGTTFFNIYDAYRFDRAIRNILLTALLQAEKNIKTKVAYRFSEQYQQPFSHLNINNFSKTDMQQVTKLVAKLSATTQSNTNAKTKDGEIYHYLTKHQDLPLWVLSNRMSFGEICSFFKCLLPLYKERILSDLLSDFEYEYSFNLNTPSSSLLPEFEKILETLVSFRNHCAHENRIYNHTVKYWKRFKNKGSKLTTISISGSIINQQSNLPANFYGILAILKLFLIPTAYKRLIKDIIKALILLKKSIPPHAFSTITKSMGISSDWKTQLKQLTKITQ